MFTKLAKILSPSLRQKEGFTLIELLIVVAIIAILAAIAIPQFSAYRMRGYNAASSSDVRNTKTNEEAIFADRQSYGVSEIGVTLATLTTVADGAGAVALGPMPAATNTVTGSALGTFIDTDANGIRDSSVGMGIAVSSGVNLRAGTGGVFANYVLVAQHRIANRAFATTGAGTAICFTENETWTTTTNEATPEATTPANMTIGCQAQAGGGSPVANWSAI